VSGTAVRIPVATNTTCGATKVYKAADCTEFTDDTYALTCAAVQKSFNYFGWGLRTRGTQFSSASITNLNTTIERGNYYANNSTQAAAISNGPTTSSGYRLIEQEGYNGTSSGYGRRFAFGSGENIYYQAETSTRGSWNPWRQIIHTGNFTTHLNGTYVNVSGDTMTGELNMNNNTVSNIGQLTFADPGVGEGISWTGGNGWNIYESPDGLTNAAGNLQFVQSSTRRMTIRTDGAVDIPSRLFVGGYNNTSYALSTSSFICNSWIRTVGSTGWYNETHGGGWYMTDGTYLRAYNNKAVLINNTYYVGTTAGAGTGLSLYGTSAPNSYGIHMSLTSNYGKHGDV
jgi:hypothetical protein